jgi:hypothetical protein
MSTLGTIDNSDLSNNYDIATDLYNLEQAGDKTVTDELNSLSQPSNLFRILGAMAGVSAVQIYNGEKNIKNLAFSAGLMGVSSIVGLQLAKALHYKGYLIQHQEEHIILPSSLGIYYLMANRSLNLSRINNNVALEALAGGIGSFSADYYFNNQKPQQ